MSRIGFLVLYATGHLNPSIALARALQRKGHQVVFFNLLDVAPAFAAAGIRMVPFAEAEYPAGSLLEIMRKIGEGSGAAAIASFIERMLEFGRNSLQSLPSLIRKEDLDLLIVDQVYPGGATLAEHLGLPFISLANALLMNRENVIPPPNFLWPYNTAPAAIERNRLGWAGVAQVFSPLLDLVNRQRRAWNLPEYTDFLEDSFSPLAQISQQPAVFEFPRPSAPSTLHFVGHLQDHSLSRTIAFPWERLDRRPLIYASLGTLQNRLDWIFRTIIEACAPLHAQTVIALGRDAIPPEFFGEVPENIILTPFAPQFELLRHATLCITHAGLNTTLDCLANGVPMVAIPIASEQPGIAMRIANLGAGTVLTLDNLNPATLGAAIDTVLTGLDYREAAQAAAREIAKTNPIVEATRIVEQVLAATQAVASR